MNSRKLYLLSAESSASASRIQRWFSQPIANIQNLPRGSCKSTFSLMWSQHCYGTGIVEPMQDLGRLCAHIISNDNSLRGMHADLAVNDELIESIQEQMKMQETNTAPIEWKVVLPEGANALPMKESMYSSGDYWTPFQDLQMQGEDHPHTEGPLQALM